MKVSDAVVEVALDVVLGEGVVDCSTDTMRRVLRDALNRALPMVVGEAVAYARVHHKANPHFHDVVLPDSQEAEMWAYDLIPLYTLTNLEDTP